MSNLINDNDTLKKYVPNTLKAVAGELSLFDKIQYHLLQAEQWLTATFVSSDTMSRIRTYSDSTPLLHYLPYHHGCRGNAARCATARPYPYA